MQERLNINVSAIDYDKTSSAIKSTLTLLEEMVHYEDGFIITDSEFAFGWHFYVVCVNRDLIEKLSDQMGSDFERIKGKGLEKKFLTWLTKKVKDKNLKIKLVIKEEMESSKYGIF
ncbi:MAG: hypothetical protein JRZ95_03270 [Nitrososphaerota archaeon]|jgi:hypothetical protein|nr:hypothetical protein [Nitrososphaerota archaeon]MDG7054315.1 hypothetical protein [Nitrososphaerota archaeon]